LSHSSAVVISGAGGGGIGTAIACAMHAQGVRVFSLERTEEARRALLKLAVCAPQDIIVADVGNEQDVVRMKSVVESSGVPLRALVHNAARGAPPRDVQSVQLTEFMEDISDILVGAFLLSKHFSDLLVSAAPSSIVFVSSSAATRGARGRGPSYSAAKAGLHGLLVSLAIEFAPSGVTVNAVAPAQTLTPRVLKGGRRTVTEINRRARKYVPMGRPATPDDVAGSVMFLCGKDARYITGKVLEIDGGQALSPLWTTDEHQ
jgi:3-oxoacyl-[acyl-carrier protein] reductase